MLAARSAGNARPSRVVWGLRPSAQPPARSEASPIARWSRWRPTTFLLLESQNTKISSEAPWLAPASSAASSCSTAVLPRPLTEGLGVRGLPPVLLTQRQRLTRGPHDRRD